MALKFTMFFKSLVFDAGWTETFYSAATQHQTLADAMTEGNGVIVKRRGILPPAYALPYFRISDANTQRDGLVIRVGASGVGTYTAVAPGANPEQPFDAVNVRLYASIDLTIWRNYLVRGVPSGARLANGRFNSASPWAADLGAYLDKLRTSNLGIYARNTVVERTLTAIDVVGTRIVRVQYSGGAVVIAPGSTVVIRNAIGASNVNGTYKVIQEQAANWLRVRRRLRPTYGTLLVDSGTISILAYSFQSITSYDRQDMTSRKTGRPSDSHPGRRRVQRD